MENEDLIDLIKAWDNPTPVALPTKDYDTAGFISTDLQEATYNQHFEVLDMNDKFLDDLLKDNSIWRIFRKLFSLRSRRVNVDSLYSKGYVTNATPIITCHGGFMGDSLSYMHMTLQMSATILASTVKSSHGYKRPIGQSSGDDAVLLKAEPELYNELHSLFKRTGMIVSKVDAFSTDSFTFCETYGVIPSDIDVIRRDYSHNSLFGDVVFLDIIKGSILSGQSKIKSTGTDPFIGHANALNTQLRYHPKTWVKERAGKLLWSANFMSAHKLSSNMASLPRPLGGLDLAIGYQVDFNEPAFHEGKLPYYEAILNSPIDEFIKYNTLLGGIYTANPKGVAWSNDEILIAKIVSQCELIERNSISIPPYLKGRDIPRYLERKLGIISVRDLVPLLARREAFLRFWKQEHSPTYVPLPLKEPKQRASKLWKLIKTSFEPNYTTQDKSFSTFTKRWEERTWGLLFKKDSDALTQIFEGMPTLYLTYL